MERFLEGRPPGVGFLIFVAWMAATVTARLLTCLPVSMLHLSRHFNMGTTTAARTPVGRRSPQQRQSLGLVGSSKEKRSQCRDEDRCERRTKQQLRGTQPSLIYLTNEGREVIRASSAGKKAKTRHCFRGCAWHGWQSKLVGCSVDFRMSDRPPACPSGQQKQTAKRKR